MIDPTKRFSSRVHDYARYRPGYPQEALLTLRAECRLTPESPIADIGAGTGRLSEIFLKNGNPVFSVEPNQEMRESGERLLNRYPGFRSINGRAEATTLPDGSVDFVINGQAFHWFDPAQCRPEFSRILKPDGIVAIVWNERSTGPASFPAAYENILARHVPDYPEMNYRQVYEKSVAEFFGLDGFQSKTFRHQQTLDMEGTKGRLLSSSYTPGAGHPNHIPMLDAITEAFKTHQIGGLVTFEYVTHMYYGPRPA